MLSQMVLIHEGKLVFYEEMDTVREMMCRIQGDKAALDVFAAEVEENQLVRRESGELGDALILYGSPTQMWEERAKRSGLSVEAVSPEDVCVYLTGMENEEKLGALWKKESA